MPVAPFTLGIDLQGLTLATPVMIASGCAGTGRELGRLVDLRKVGGIVSRTVTVAPRAGGPLPRIAESPSGVVWSTGLQNPGVDAFVGEELPGLVKPGVPVFVSIGGGSLEEYVRLASLLRGRSGVVALELFLSGPDEELGGGVLGAQVERCAEIVGAVARMSTMPVFAKLPALVVDPVAVAVACVRAGAHGLVLCGPLPALAVDEEASIAGSVSGWLAGPAMRPVVLRAILEVGLALPGVPLIASGGVRTGDDAVRAMAAGAWAVQVGTGVLVDPSAPVDVASELARTLRASGFSKPAQLVGTLGATGSRRRAGAGP
jgi:dihydroorotate dehydrogenase (NAD+) catalytic subunit